MPQVYPVIADWRLSEGIAETTGTKVFVDVKNSAEAVTLPALNSAFDNENPTVKAIRITHTYLPGDGDCGKRYTVDYSTITAPPKPPDILEPDPADTDDLVWTVNISSSIQSAETAGIWTWESDSQQIPVDLALPKRRINVELEVRRVLYADVILPYAVLLGDLAGTINGQVWNNFLAKKVLFLGADTVQAFDSQNRPCWDVRLRWSASSVEWDKVYRASKGDYDRPLHPVTGALLETRTNAQWAPLFTTGKTPPA